MNCQRLKERIYNIDAQPLNELCDPISLGDSRKKSPPTPKIRFITHSDDVGSMLPLLFKVQESHVFRKTWTRKAVRKRENEPAKVLSLEDVEKSIWRPVYSKMKRTSSLLVMGSITFNQVQAIFGDINNRPDELLKEVQKLMSVHYVPHDDDARKRVAQIETLFRYQKLSQVTTEILDVRDAFGLKGDFKPLEELQKCVSNLKTTTLLMFLTNCFPADRISNDLRLTCDLIT